MGDQEGMMVQAAMERVVAVGDRCRPCWRSAGLQIDERQSRRAPLGGK